MNKFFIFRFENGSYRPTGVSCPNLEFAVDFCERSVNNHPNEKLSVFELKSETTSGRPITTRF